MRHHAALRCYREVDATDEIAADACLVELDRERAVFDRGSLRERLFGNGVQRLCRRAWIRVRRCRGGKQRVDIDPARGKLARRLGVRAEIERELALHHLRTAFGMNGNLEGWQLGMVRRGVELALQLEGREMCVGVGRLVAWLRRAVRCRRLRGLLRWRLPACLGAGGCAWRNAHDDGAVVAGFVRKPVTSPSSR